MAASSEHSAPSTDRTVGRSDGVIYREQLRTPIWWYLIAVGLAGLIAVELEISTLHLTDWIVVSVLGPLLIVVVWASGRWRIEVVSRDGVAELRVRGAHIALSEVSGAIALDARMLRRVVGREGDPAAFLTIRPWIGPGVQLWVDDAEDPTPYWIVSSRRPQRLVDAVRSLL